MPILAQRPPIASREWLLSNGLRILIITVVAVLVSWIARQAVRRMQRKLERTESVTQAIDIQRATTLTHSLSYVIRLVIWSLALLMILDQFAVSLAPLIAGAGIAGVALGFGAQSLVRDFLSGFFILLENQFGVGDVIEANATGLTVTGKVEQISLRTTSVRAFDGTLHFIPNGNIQSVGNRSKGWARAIVDIGIGYGESLERVNGVLDGLFEEIRTDPKLASAIISGPEVLGVEMMTDYEVVLRIVAEVRPSRRFDIERELRGRVKERFDREGIEIPFPHRVMISRPEGPSPAAERPKRAE